MRVVTCQVNVGHILVLYTELAYSACVCMYLAACTGDKIHC